MNKTQERRIRLVVLAGLSLLLACVASQSARPRGSAGGMLPCPASPNCVSSHALDPDHFAEPLPLKSEPWRAIERLRALIEAMPRARVTESNEQELHAEFTSLLFRFVDDVDAAVDAENKVVHIRSAARVGYSDLGVNRRRVEALRQAWETGSPQ